MLKKIKCSLYRGGTSKAAFFVREDLPEKAEDRDILFQKVMGGNDPKQIDGLGGAQIVTSKVAVVGKSSMPGCDLDYTFVQVYPNKCGVDYSANCGNISSAVAMFAIERGLAEPEDGVTCLRIFNTNTNKVIVETLQTPQRRVSCEGNYSIVGVPGTGAPIVLKFEKPAGAITGELTPTGKPTDRIQLPSGKQVRCSVIDCTSLFVFVPMKEFGLNGTESISELESRKDLLDDLEYAFFGQAFPGVWAHKNFSFNQVFQTLYHTTNGIYGSLVGTSATMLAMFSIFGAVLSETGGAGTFIKVGQKVAGGSIGGPGKVNLIASGLFGMISGSALGNVVATGTLTIPLMKESGYDSEWSGAVSAVGSTGGQIMPPIMGTGAFIMATNIGIPYLGVAKAAIFPALFYYMGAYVAIHYIAKKLKIKGEKDDEPISVIEYAKIVLPLAIFLFFLIKRYSVTFSAFYSTLVGLAVCGITFFFEGKAKEVPKKFGDLLFKSTINGATSIIDIAALLAGAQITISLVSMTGFGVKLSNMIISIGRDHLFLCLLLSMLVCIVLGMGLPTTASYVLSASILVPALTGLGLNALTAHMFVFFFQAC